MHIVPNVIAGMMLSIVVGAFVAVVILWLFARWRSTSRILDLVSFSVAGIALAASVFAIAAYEKRINHAGQLIELEEAAQAAVHQIRSIADQNCPLATVTPPLDPKALECWRVREYASSLIDLNFPRGVTLPSPPEIRNPSECPSGEFLNQVNQL